MSRQGPRSTVRMCAALAALLAFLLVPASAEARYGARTLKVGSQGSDVKQLQKYLTRLGLRTPADGAYGRATARNVKSFERREGRPADGKATPTDQRLIRAEAKSQTAAAPETQADGTTEAGTTGGSAYDGDAGNATGKA